MTKTFRLHTTDLSPFGQRAKLALSAKGLLPRTQLIDTFGGTKALLALAPMQQIPILEHDGRILPESQVIVDYLEDISLDTPLAPKSPEDRAIARLFTRLTDLYIAPHFLSLIVAMRSPMEDGKLAATFESLQRGLDFIEHYLPEQAKYCITGQLTMADLALAPFLFYVPRLSRWHGHDAFDVAPKCKAYLDKIADESIIAKAFTEMENAYIARVDSLNSQV